MFLSWKILCSCIVDRAILVKNPFYVASMAIMLALVTAITRTRFVPNGKSIVQCFSQESNYVERTQMLTFGLCITSFTVLSKSKLLAMQRKTINIHPAL